MTKNNIAIITCFQNKDLFRITRKCNLCANIPIYSFDGRGGVYGLKFLNYIGERSYYFRKYEVLVFLDEDFIIVDNITFAEYLDCFINSQFTFCGVRDGGETPMRDYSPIIPNTFCLFMKTKGVFERFNKNQILTEPSLTEADYTEVTEYKYSYSLFSKVEPYYKFFLFYIRKGMKVKFIKTKSGLYNATIVCDDKEQLFGVHTWYARDFGKDGDTTKRIFKILNEYKAIERSFVPFIPIPINSLIGKIKLRWYKILYSTK